MEEEERKHHGQPVASFSIKESQNSEGVEGSLFSQHGQPSPMLSNKSLKEGKEKPNTSKNVESDAPLPLTTEVPANVTEDKTSTEGKKTKSPVVEEKQNDD